MGIECAKGLHDHLFEPLQNWQVLSEFEPTLATFAELNPFLVGIAFVVLTIHHTTSQS
jgi:hypothetical protein